MDIINYSSSFIPNEAADDSILYRNIKNYNPNFSIEYEYLKEFNLNVKYSILRTQYDVGQILDVLDTYNYSMEVRDDAVYITVNNPAELADRLDITVYKLYEDLLEILPDGRNDFDIDTMKDVVRYESNTSRGYIHISLDNIYTYYHVPEPIFIEEQYNQYHLDYLKNYGITLYSLAEEQRYLYTLARELPKQYTYILEYRDKVDSVIFNQDTIHIIVRDMDNITIDSATLDIFKSLIANLYHGNTCYDYIRLTNPNKIIKTYSLDEL